MYIYYEKKFSKVFFIITERRFTRGLVGPTDSFRKFTEVVHKFKSMTAECNATIFIFIGWFDWKF